MKKNTQLRASALIGTSAVLGFVLGAIIQRQPGIVETRAGAEEKPAQPSVVTNAQPEASTNSGLLPDQSHAMTDVGYHFANLWFAADKENWPLAKYYLQGTRSHLNWAIRLHPVRTISTGGEVSLKGILEAMDNSQLAAIDSAITNKDTAAFKTALEMCYACHKALEKPFLRPQVPSAPSVSIRNFDPNATWPQ